MNSSSEQLALLLTFVDLHFEQLPIDNHRCLDITANLFPGYATDHHSHETGLWLIFLFVDESEIGSDLLEGNFGFFINQLRCHEHLVLQTHYVYLVVVRVFLSDGVVDGVVIRGGLYEGR